MNKIIVRKKLSWLLNVSMLKINKNLLEVPKYCVVELIFVKFFLVSKLTDNNLITSHENFYF